MKRLLLLSILALLCSSAFAHGKIKVACVGNSITYGSTLDDPATQSYPAQLQDMLGMAYEVRNFGRPGATLLKHGHRPYNEQPEYAEALAFAPDIAIIHLGINDTDPRNWPNFNSEFVTDYLELIENLRQTNPEMQIYIANLTPLRATHHRFKSGTRDWRLQIRQAIKDVAKAANVGYLDFNPPLRDRQDLLPDGIHPNIEGSKLLAKEAYKVITGDFGGLQMPAIYQSGMVLQRDRNLKIAGQANPGSMVSVEIDNRLYTALADQQGQWAVTIAPLSPEKTYKMTITDGDTTLKYNDILAGEVWVASGQSNMAFTLSEAIGSESAIANADDPMLRFYNMKPIKLTNSGAWDSISIRETNNLRYFKPAWEKATPENAPHWSAIAYFFARELRDSLQVPVAIISNAVGGAPTEAWIDINWLEREIPETLLDWRGNDYTQRWAQGRAKENAPNSRHPYEPSYLFASGIRPLEHFPVAGVIWYQGESNAHNIEIHERLFPLLVDNWRDYFEMPNMPFYFAQLSSINRPSWPQFRDSQRRMASQIPGVEMAVTSDHGDSLDVHPRHKAPIGHRLASIALHNTYGYDGVEYSGPALKRAYSRGEKMILEMDHAQGMRSSDGQPLRTFELAEIDGLYYPAQAEINGNQIILTSMDIKSPKYARYGWQPFTRANLVNSDGLPASTFKAKAENATDFEPEAGIENGVSGAFSGLIGEGNFRAGGCNFPGNPLAADAQKKYYQGIYILDPALLTWHRVADLPQPMAYGAYADADGISVLIGGHNGSEPLSEVYALRHDGKEYAMAQLPALPAPIDNAYAAAIGHKVYVVGGNLDNAPSRALFVLDLDNPDKGWQRLRDMPGNPRVQPVMAAAKNAKGEECLYVWGGFSTANGNPTIETSGLCYSPSKNKWTALPAPIDSDGVEITLSGGAATTLPDGRILAAGGVNKNIFLNALRSLPEGYLSHPIEWYKFNPNVLIFDPSTDTWTIDHTTLDAARAGANIITTYHGASYLIGGEVKPRVRTTLITPLH